jgi:GT2 family glycosyltransferase
VTCQAILVNYHCAALIAEAVRSIGEYPGLSIDVVDNSVSADQRTALQQSLPANSRVSFPERNLGFGQACNLAFGNGQSEFVLLLNPDARLMPGALGRMISTLRSGNRLAAVGPRVYWDSSRQFLMPLSTFPSATWYLRSCLAGVLPSLNASAAQEFRRSALAAWRASLPFPVEALSGGHVLLRRSAVLKAGGLFDPDFFMYWEDSDLMSRLKSKGFQLMQDPRAEAIHLYGHSPAKEAMIQSGWQVYSRKHFGGLFWKLISGLKNSGRENSTSGGWVPLDWTDGDLRINVSERLTSWLLEISPAPDFVPAIGHLGSDRTITVPVQLLRSFAGCSVYLRLSSAQAELSEAVVWLLNVPEFDAETNESVP